MQELSCSRQQQQGAFRNHSVTITETQALCKTGIEQVEMAVSGSVGCLQHCYRYNRHKTQGRQDSTHSRCYQSCLTID
jgi:hypothetical protein